MVVLIERFQDRIDVSPLYFFDYSQDDRVVVIHQPQKASFPTCILHGNSGSPEFVDEFSASLLSAWIFTTVY